MKRLTLIMVLMLVALGLVAQMQKTPMENTDGKMHKMNHSDGQGMNSEMKGEHTGMDMDCTKGKNAGEMKMKGCMNGGCEKMKSKSGGMMKQKMATKKESMSLSRFNITPEQKEQYEEEHYIMKLKKIEIQAEVKKLALQYDHAIKMADFTEAKKVNKVLFQKKAALENLHLELKMKFYNLLDDQQKTLWVQPETSCEKTASHAK